MLYYPQEPGRNFDEFLRMIKGFQLSDSVKVAIPANWPNNELIGDRVIILPAQDVDTAARGRSSTLPGRWSIGLSGMTAIHARRFVPFLLSLMLFLAGGAAPLRAAEEGLASWYGGKFQGRKTASGEIFDANLFTAAHRTLPFGTLVRVTNLDTGQETVVRINDRGPFVAGRIIDLSRAAAAAIGMAGAGVARVRVEVLPPGEGNRTATQRRYTVQLGAFRTESYAESMRREAIARGFAAQVERGVDGIYRVVVFHVFEQELQEMRRRLAKAGWRHTLARLER